MHACMLCIVITYVIRIPEMSLYRINSLGVCMYVCMYVCIILHIMYVPQTKEMVFFKVEKTPPFSWCVHKYKPVKQVLWHKDINHM